MYGSSRVLFAEMAGRRLWINLIQTDVLQVTALPLRPLVGDGEGGGGGGRGEHVVCRMSIFKKNMLMLWVSVAALYTCRMSIKKKKSLVTIVLLSVTFLYFSITISMLQFGLLTCKCDTKAFF